MQVGGHFEHMLDLQVGEDKFLRRMGIVPVKVSTSEFAGQLTNVTPADAAACVKRYRRVFEIGSNVSDFLLEKTARGEAALRAILAPRAARRAA